jgi:hypothetical protein
MPLLDWAMPSRYHSIHKNETTSRARWLLSRSRRSPRATLPGSRP